MRGTASMLFAAAGALLASHAVAAPSLAECSARNNDSRAKLIECIQGNVLWNHLAHFQTIADEHPSPNGHGNRNTGTSGYHASVAFVAGLMRKAGYKVKIQPYDWRKFELEGAQTFSAEGRDLELAKDWFVARLSASGDVTGEVQAPGVDPSGCSPDAFRTFERGRIALVERGRCDADTAVANAQAAGAAAVILYNSQGATDAASSRGHRDGGAYKAQLSVPAAIPVAGFVSYGLGKALARESGPVHLAVHGRSSSSVDYNLIADSPYGDRRHVVVVDAHLDSIYGAGMLDNASGSTTILDIALAMAHTQTTNQLRYIWFGGEELGLLGSRHYTRTLTPAELRRIVFDIDVDVTATPNFDILVADPANAFNVGQFPPDVVPDSRVGNDAFADAFGSARIISRNASFGNDGTDSNSFALAGVPDSGVLTNQDCCKQDWEVDLWGGFKGNYEGIVPGHNGGCVDWSHRWCDNLSNNDRFVLEFVSKATATVVLELANDAKLDRK